MATSRERLEELRKLASAETPRQKLEKLKSIESGINPGTATDAFIEPAIALGTGVAGTVAGGLLGLLQTANPFAESGAGARAVKSVQESLTVAPETQSGQQGLESLMKGAGELTELLSLGGMVPSVTGGVADLLTGGDLQSSIQTAADIKERGLPSVLADKTLQETDSPLAATAVFLAPDIAETILGFGAAKSFKSPAKQKFAEDIAKGGPEAHLIRDGAGFIVNGPAQAKAQFKEAVKQGFDPGIVAAVKGGSPTDKVNMKAMLSTLKKARKDAVFASENRPSDIAGQSLMKRVSLIKKVNKSSGQRLDDVAKTLKGQPADASTPVKNFSNSMDEMGISLNEDLTPNFAGSIIEGIDKPEKAIKNIVKRVKPLLSGEKDITRMDAFDLHRMKKFIDENVSFGGKGGEGLSGKTETVLKSLRRDIDGVLDANFPKYDNVNSAFSKTRETLDELQKAVGPSINFNSPQANKAFGTELRSLLSKNKKRIQLDDAIKKVESTTKEFGGEFNDNLRLQTLFADELDAIFQTQARTSLQGEVGKLARKANQPKTDLALEAAGSVIEKARGINEENAIKAIEAILE